MQQFIAYPTSLDMAAVDAAVAVADGTSTLSLNEKVNALEAVQMYGAGVLLPITAPTPAASTQPKQPLARDQLAAELKKLKAAGGKAAAGAINWPGVVAAVIALVKSLLGP